MISLGSIGSSTCPFDRGRDLPALISLPAPQPGFDRGDARENLRGAATHVLDLSCCLRRRACDRRGRGTVDQVKNLETEPAAEEGRYGARGVTATRHAE